MLSLFRFYGILKADKRTKHVGIKTKQKHVLFGLFLYKDMIKYIRMILYQ